MGKKRGEEERGKKRTKRGVLKEGLSVLFLSGIFLQGRDLESCGDLSWEDLLEKPEELSDFEPDAQVEVLVVSDVSVSPSSVVTEFCDSLWFGSDRGSGGTAVLSFLQKSVPTFVQLRRKR